MKVIFLINCSILFLLFLTSLWAIFYLPTTKAGKESARKLPLLMLKGFGIQFLIAFFIGVIQALFVLEGLGGNPLWIQPLVTLYSVPYNMGGLTVRFIFEALVTDRQFVVQDSLPQYFSILTVQVGLICYLFAVRYRARGKLLDPGILALGVLYVLNSALNITWPWWGS